MGKELGIINFDAERPFRVLQPEKVKMGIIAKAGMQERYELPGDERLHGGAALHSRRRETERLRAEYAKVHIRNHGIDVDSLPRGPKEVKPLGHEKGKQIGHQHLAPNVLKEATASATTQSAAPSHDHRSESLHQWPQQQQREGRQLSVAREEILQLLG